MKHDAEDAIARLLRDRVGPDSPTGSCLDADVVAAWFDGTLTDSQQREAESHASTCAHCQALLATMTQVEPVAAPSRRSLWLMRWFAPALAAAAAVLVWINVDRRSVDVPAVALADRPAAAPAVSTPAQEPDAPQTTRAPRPRAPSANLLQKSAGGAAANEPARESNKTSQKALDRRAEALERDSVTAFAPSSPIVRSPDGLLWRIARDTVGRSSDNGITWREQRLGSPARILGGSSPSPNVVWFAGAGGIVVMTTDGVSWQWRSLPERMDVTGIAAVDGRTATVTTRDGRRFVTHDGGLRWVPAAVQENPAAPF